MTEQQKSLAESNHNLIYSFLLKYHLPFEDWYDLAAIGLCKAAMTFKEDVSTFSTYAYRCMFTSVMQEKRKETQSGTIPEYQIFYYQSEVATEMDGNVISFLDTMPSKENTESDAVANLIYVDFLNSLKDKDRTIFSLIADGYKQKDISKLVGCSQPQVSRVKKKLAKYLLV